MVLLHGTFGSYKVHEFLFLRPLVSPLPLDHYLCICFCTELKSKCTYVKASNPASSQQEEDISGSDYLATKCNSPCEVERPPPP